MNDDERALKVGDLMWLIVESAQRHENKMASVTEVFPRDDGVIRSASINTANGVLRRPSLGLAPVFYEPFGNENRAGDVGAEKLDNK